MQKKIKKTAGGGGDAAVGGEMEVLGVSSAFVCYVQPAEDCGSVKEVDVVGAGVKVGTMQQQYGAAMYRLKDLKTVLF